MGKVFSSRETFRIQMPRILQAKKSVSIEMIGENLFLLDFQSPADRNHALWDGPWSFFKDLIIFQDPRGLQNPSDLVFNEMAIWMQCHDVPLAFMHAPTIHSIGDRIGRVLEVESGVEGRCKGCSLV